MLRTIVVSRQPYVIIVTLLFVTIEFSGHSEAVLSVAFSPDSRQLASGSGDTTVRFWDIYTQTPLHTCTGAHFSPRFGKFMCSYWSVSCPQ